MKKLMIAAAIVCAAACSQGAALLWNWGVTGAASTIMDAEPKIVANTTAFLFANYATEDAMYEAADGIIASLRTSKGDTSVLSGATDTGAIGSNGKMAANQEIGSSAFGDNDKNYMFAVIVGEDAAGNKWAAINDLAKKGLGTGGTAMNFSYSGFDEDYIYAGLSDNYTTAEGAGWFQLTEGATPTPEPTSGLLLLLGVAGLALRRKQK